MKRFNESLGICQSGVALLNDGKEWYLVRAPHATPAVTRFSSAIRLLDGSTDVTEVRDADLKSVESELEAARAKDTALQYVLVLIEENEIGELERRILARLKELLFFPNVPEFILNRLYSAPLTQSSLNQAKALIAHDPRHPVSEILTSIVEHQWAITRVRSVWENVSAGRFADVRKKDEFFLSAVERGLVAKLAWNPGTVLRESSQTADQDREIIQGWAKAAGAQGEVAGGANLDREPAEDSRAESASAAARELLLRQVDELLLSSGNGPKAERDRQIFWLYYRQEMSAREIASLPHIKLSVKGVESALQRTTRMVRCGLTGELTADRSGITKFLEHLTWGLS